MAINSMQDLFIEELRDTYHAEKQLARALPKLAKAVRSEKLREALQTHTEETKGQIERIQQVFEMLGSPARAKRCEAMEGLIEEVNELMDENMSEQLLDVAIIAAQQKVEHYEIAAYGTLRTMAEQLGNKEVAQLLEQTLNEEKKTDQLLNEIALGEVNQTAMQGEQEEEGEEMETAGASKSKSKSKTTASRGNKK